MKKKILFVFLFALLLKTSFAFEQVGFNPIAPVKTGAIIAQGFSQGTQKDKPIIGLFPGGLTFSENFRQDFYNDSLLADYARGRRIFAFTRTTSASVPASRISPAGIIQLITNNNLLRYQGGYYDTTGFHAQRGLMIEGSRTNLLKDSYFSQTFATYWRASSGTASQSSDIANIYGGGTVGKLVSSAQNDSLITSNAAKPTLVSGTTYSYSALVSGSGTAKMCVDDQGGEGYIYGTAISLTTTPRLISLVTAATADGTANVGVASNDGSTTCYIHIIQCEAAPYASSFIPTTTASLARNSEVLTYPILNNRTAAQETIFIKFAPRSDFANDGVERRLSSAETKGRSFSKATAGIKINFQPNSTDSASCLAQSTITPLANTSYVITGVCKHASPYAEIYVNGISEETETSDNFINNAWGTLFSIGSTSAGANQLFGIVQDIKIFGRKMTAGEVKIVNDLINLL